uniref:Uncharacterized protein n=1 Tax=Dunaliella tertiolecta TaxID=3047 RepID=A0A7S3QNP4_DUNTE
MNYTEAYCGGSALQELCALQEQLHLCFMSISNFCSHLQSIGAYQLHAKTAVGKWRGCINACNLNSWLSAQSKELRELFQTLLPPSFQPSQTTPHLHESPCCDDVHPCKTHISAAAFPLYRKTTGNIDMIKTLKQDFA